MNDTRAKLADYVANVRVCRQVGIEQFQFFTESHPVMGGETVAEVFEWANNAGAGNANIELVKAT